MKNKFFFFFKVSRFIECCIFEVDSPSLKENPTISHIKIYEEKLKKYKIITCLLLGLTNLIFTKIIDLKAPNLTCMRQYPI